MNSNMEYRQFLTNNAKKIMDNNNILDCHYDNTGINTSFFLPDKKSNLDLQENFIKQYEKFAYKFYLNTNSKTIIK